MSGGVRQSKDGLDWHIGTDADVDWIRARTTDRSAPTFAIPPVFDSYAFVALPDLDYGPRTVLVPEYDQALLALLERHTPGQPWWLGYLETGASDTIFYSAPKVTLYWGWHYVLVEAGPEQAGSWRPSGDWTNWKTTELPELIFPRDRSWLLSTLWDDDWTWVGGPEALIADLLADDVLASRARRVTVGHEVDAR